MDWQPAVRNIDSLSGAPADAQRLFRAIHLACNFAELLVSGLRYGSLHYNTHAGPRNTMAGLNITIGLERGKYCNLDCSHSRVPNFRARPDEHPRFPAPAPVPRAAERERGWQVRMLSGLPRRDMARYVVYINPGLPLCSASFP